MAVRLEPEQRSLLADVRKRARTLDQYYAARALLALDAGTPVVAISRKLGVNQYKIAKWSINFQRHGIEYVIALGCPSRHGRAGRPGSRPRRAVAAPPGDEELMRQIQAGAPRMADLVRMARTPSAVGADLDADPADLFRIA